MTVPGFVVFVRKLSELAGMLAAAMIAASVLIVCQMVLARYVLGKPTTWQTELVTYLLVGATLIGSPYVLKIRGHVSVDLLPHYLSERGKKRQQLASAAAGMAFCGVLLWSGCVLWYDAWADKWLSDTVWAVPLWIPYAALPIGFALMLLQYVADVSARVIEYDEYAEYEGHEDAS